MPQFSAHRHLSYEVSGSGCRESDQIFQTYETRFWLKLRQFFMISTSVVRQKLDLRCNFFTLIRKSIGMYLKFSTYCAFNLSILTGWSDNGFTVMRALVCLFTLIDRLWYNGTLERHVYVTKITISPFPQVEEAKVELKEVVEFLRSPEKFTKLGGKLPSGKEQLNIIYSIRRTVQYLQLMQTIVCFAIISHCSSWCFLKCCYFYIMSLKWRRPCV